MSDDKPLTYSPPRVRAQFIRNEWDMARWRIFRVLDMTEGPRLGTHGGPIYGNVDGLAVETDGGDPWGAYWWWGNGPISEQTHTCVALVPADSDERDEGAA